VIAFERVKRLVQRSGASISHPSPRGGSLKILIDRTARVDAVVDAVKAGHQHRGEGQVGIAGGIGERNSTRFARGFGEYIGIRQQAERLRWE